MKKKKKDGGKEKQKPVNPNGSRKTIVVGDITSFCRIFDENSRRANKVRIELAPQT